MITHGQHDEALLPAGVEAGDSLRSPAATMIECHSRAAATLECIARCV